MTKLIMGNDSIVAEFTLICAVVEDIEGLHRCRAPLLVAKDQIDPLMKVC